MDGLNGLMEPFLKAILLKIKLRAEELRFSIKVANSLDSGKIIKWKAREYILEIMETPIMANLLKVKGEDLELLFDLMDKNI